MHGGVTVKKRSKRLKIHHYIGDDSYSKHRILKRKHFAYTPFQLVSSYRSSVLLLHRWTCTESDLFKVSRSSMRPRYFPKKPSDYFLKCFNSLIPDLRSLPEQLLLLQSQPFLLDLLQSHLIVASHDSAVGAGSQLPSLLHWSTLGDPLLVQGCKRQKRRILNFAY